MTAQIEQTNDEYKIICKHCQHFIRVDKASAEKFEDNPEDFKCELCFVEPGKPKLVRTLVHCAECRQTYDSRSNCECPPKFSKITVDFNPGHKRSDKDMKRFFEDQEGYNAKTTRIFNNKVLSKRLEAEQRQIRVDENLIKIAELLQKLVEKKESKVV